MTDGVTRHEHHKRFDMDNPWLTCDCGGYWDALTGEPMKVDTATRPVTPEFARGYSAGFTAAATAGERSRADRSLPTCPLCGAELGPLALEVLRRWNALVRPRGAHEAP